MRKLRKFLRILFIILPFSVSVASAEHSGGTSDVHYYNHGGGTSGGTEWTEHGGGLSTDPTWINSMRGEKENFSPDFKEYAEKFLYYWDYFHMYGTTEDVPGLDISSDNWNIPFDLTLNVQYQYEFADSPGTLYWTTYPGILVSDALSNYTYTYTDPWGATYNFSWNNGQFNYTIDFDGIDRNSIIPVVNSIRVQVIQWNNTVPGVNYIYSPNQVGTFIVPISDCSVTDSSYLHVTSGMSRYFLHLDENEGVIYFKWADFQQGGASAPEKPTPVYPTDTTNNYYNNEVNYYNYMQNALDLIEDSASVNDFQFDYDWGLLSLPAGIFAGTLEALGEYSSICTFHVNQMQFDILGIETLTIPGMSFSFDANEYNWLLPFRYLIALSLLYVICKQGWLLFANIVNGGNADE